MRRIKIAALALSFTATSYAFAVIVPSVWAKAVETTQTLRDHITSRLTRVEIVREYIPHPEKPLSTLINETATRHKLPSILLASLIMQESGEKLRTDRVRYEEHLQARFKCKPYETEAECRAYASSWGLGQVVYGIWHKFCGLDSYSDLLDPETNLNCAASILRECLDRRKESSNFDKVRGCLSEYNGDRTGRYSREVLDRYVKISLDRNLGVGRETP